MQGRAEAQQAPSEDERPGARGEEGAPGAREEGDDSPDNDTSLEDEQTSPETSHEESSDGPAQSPAAGNKDSPSEEPPDPGASTSDDGGIEMPALLDAPAPIYPSAAEGSGKSTAVDLLLSLDEQGNVTGAEVRESAGAAFDEEATRVALLYKFAPATKHGVAVASRIAVRIAFTPPPVEEPPPKPVASEEVPSPSEPGLPFAAEIPEEEVLVLGKQEEKKRLAQSADAVTIIDLAEQKARSSDMGEVLARSPGLVVRRAGGVGSNVRVSLNGLYDNAVREFVDGVPLWMTPFPENVGSLPVNLFDHVEVYRGVVPLRLAADTLGGAINFVTDRTYHNHAAGSFQTGSFGTYRGTVLGQYRHQPTNFVARVVGYADSVKNDYKVDVEVPDETGRLAPVTVPLFNKSYSAYGAMVEAGFVEKPWAKRLLVRGFVAGTDTEIQHNQVMSVVYGEPYWGDDVAGAALVYDQDFGSGVHVSTTTNYTHRRVFIKDLGEHVYNWKGERVRERLTPGEIFFRPLDQTGWRNAVFHRTVLEWEMLPESVVLATTTPLFSTQTGRDNRWNSEDPDPQRIRNSITSVVSALGHELNLFPMPGASKDPKVRRRGTDFRLQNTFTVKSYLYHVDSTEALDVGGFRTHTIETHEVGLGDALRFAFTKWLFLKGSYEYARRLPDPFEIFGDGALVAANIELVPEVSHNVNVGPLLDWSGTRLGDFVALANLAYRDSENMIVLLGTNQQLTYRNVYGAETWSGEGGLSWTSPHDFVTLDGSATYNDSRNRADRGPFAEFSGDQIPNRSPLSISWGVRLSFRNLVLKRDRLEPFYQGRYTQGFFKSWESLGITEFKDRVENQAVHDAGITYINEFPHSRLSNTLEMQNLTNENLYDDFGVQRPGRAIYWKVTAELF